jgi:hypothetical protein
MVAIPIKTKYESFEERRSVREEKLFQGLMNAGSGRKEIDSGDVITSSCSRSERMLDRQHKILLTASLRKSRSQKVDLLKYGFGMC